VTSAFYNPVLTSPRGWPPQRLKLQWVCLSRLSGGSHFLKPPLYSHPKTCTPQSQSHSKPVSLSTTHKHSHPIYRSLPVLEASPIKMGWGALWHGAIDALAPGHEAKLFPNTSNDHASCQSLWCVRPLWPRKEGQLMSDRPWGLGAKRTSSHKNVFRGQCGLLSGSAQHHQRAPACHRKGAGEAPTQHPALALLRSPAICDAFGECVKLLCVQGVVAAALCASLAL